MEVILEVYAADPIGKQLFCGMVILYMNSHDVICIETYNKKKSKHKCPPLNITVSGA